MKIKTYLISFIALGYLVTAGGQNMVSIHGGINWAKIPDARGNSEPVEGKVFGARYVSQKQNGWSLVYGLGLVQKGGFDSGAGVVSISNFLFEKNLFVYSEGDVSLSYLECSFAGKYGFLKNKSINPYISAGPYVGYAISGKKDLLIRISDSSGHSETIIDRGKIDFGEVEMNRLELGVFAGGGMGFSLPGLHLFVEYNLGLGLTHLDKSAREAVRNFYHSIQVGFGIPI